LEVDSGGDGPDVFWFGGIYVPSRIRTLREKNKHGFTWIPHAPESRDLETLPLVANNPFEREEVRT
jgi:hypothetical protein